MERKKTSCPDVHRYYGKLYIRKLEFPNVYQMILSFFLKNGVSCNNVFFKRAFYSLLQIA